MGNAIHMEMPPKRERKIYIYIYIYIYKAGAASCRRIAALLLRRLNGRAENYNVLQSTLLWRLFYTTLWTHGLCVLFHNFGITSLILTKFL